MTMSDTAARSGLMDRNNFGPDDLVACGWGEGEWEPYPRLPVDEMLMLDRVVELSSTGGTYGKGCIVAEYDIYPERWFFPIHFRGRPLMPACLALDGFWQATGFGLGMRGALGDGVALHGSIKFEGMIEPDATLLRYIIDVRQVRLRSEQQMSIILAEGILERDGMLVATAKDLMVGVAPRKK